MKLILILSFCASTCAIFAQEQNQPNTGVGITVRHIDQPIILDGSLDEAIWNQSNKAQNFSQYFPSDSTLANAQTEISMCYDATHLYVAIKCYSKGNDFVTPSLKRDHNFSGNDNITILFDTYNDNTNSFAFGINPYGVRRDALVFGGGRSGGDMNMSWDNKWDGESKIHENYWTAEMAIPFKTIRFNDGSEKWRFNSYRFDTQHNEISCWINIPRSYIIMDMSYMGDMTWEEPLEKTGTNISIIPYVATSLTRDFEEPTETSTQKDFSFGGDAKIALNSSLNLDLTINPDFSQVEVDQQVTNLDRFEIFFPERRQFFLENADLFGGFGNSRVNPFFSRRIGVALDTLTDNNVQNTILYGARLSGKINDKLRVGLLNMQTAAQGQNDLPAFNYTVAAMEHKVFSKSNVAFMMVNKQALNPSKYGKTYYDYNRAMGAEYRLISKDNTFSGKLAAHTLFTPKKIENKNFLLGQLIKNTRKYRLEIEAMMIGNGYEPEVGFVPRNNFMRLSPEGSINFFPKKGNIAQHTFGFDYDRIYTVGSEFYDDDINNTKILGDYELQESNWELFWRLSFNNNSNINLGFQSQGLTLLGDFDPTRVQEDDVFLRAGDHFRYNFITLNYRSDQRKVFTWNIRPNIGQFFNGFRTGVNGSFRYRFQPFGFISLDYTFNHINLTGYNADNTSPDFEKTNLWLVGPRIELTFSKNLFLTTFIQYNDQSENLNINARFQWRFAPVSDFFIVYTDNYITDPFDRFNNSRNRALVAKFTYWLNL